LRDVHLLEEFVFRFNRRFYPMAGFETLLGLTSKVEPSTYEELRGPMPDDGIARRRGRSTGLTQLKRRAAKRLATERKKEALA
jgi:hypothetical protein